MKISSLSELRELLQLLQEQKVEQFDLSANGDLRIGRRNSDNVGMYIPMSDAAEYSEPNVARSGGISAAAEDAQNAEDEDLLYYATDRGNN